MRLKYRKFQYGGVAGGGFYSVPVINDIPQSQGDAGWIGANNNLLFNPQKPKINREQFKPDLSELFKNLKGHTNEVNQVQKIKNELDKKLNSLSDLDILSQSSNFQSVLQGYSSLMSGSLKNQLERSKERTDESFKIANQKNNLAQYSVKGGKVKVLDQEGKLRELPLIAALQAQKNGEVIIPTNSKWWQERDTNPNLSDNANLSQELTYGVNIDQVIDKWRKNLSGLGSSEYGGKHSKAIDIVSKGIATGNTDFAQEIMQGSKHDDNYRQVDDALQMSMNAMSQEEIDSLYSFAAGRLTAMGEEPTPQNIKKQMYASLFNLADSKKDISDFQESSYGQVNISDIGKEKIRASGAGQEKMEQVSFVEDARNGRTTRTTLTMADPSKTTAGAMITAAGFDMGIVTDSKDGKVSFGLMSANQYLNEPMKPLIVQGSGKTPNNRSIKDDNFIPEGKAVYTFVLQDRNGNIAGNYSTAAEAQADIAKKGGQFQVVEKVAVKGYSVSKSNNKIWGGTEFESDIDAGKMKVVGDETLKKHLATIFNQNQGTGENNTATKEGYRENTFHSDDEIVETVVFYDVTEPQTWRDKQNKVLYPQENAQLKAQYDNRPSFSGGNSTSTKSPVKITTPE